MRFNTNERRWRFDPEPESRIFVRPYIPRRKEEKESWIAPEHARMALGMKKDFPRDSRGFPIPGEKKRLVLDPRPIIMVPARKPRFIPIYEPNNQKSS